MKIAIPTETQTGEGRVAASPDTVKAYVKKGLEVVVQAGAGHGAHISDDAFAAAGAKIVKDGFGDADIVLGVRRPSAKLLKTFEEGCGAGRRFNPAMVTARGSKPSPGRGSRPSPWN